jgi:Phosphotransferase enzyme family.
MNRVYQLDETASHFNFRGRFIKAEPYGCGHINDTYAAYFEEQDRSVLRYILQRINTSIFTDPEKLMRNIELVTAHIKNRLLACGEAPDRKTLIIVRTKDGKTFYKDEYGEYWRSYVFIEGAQTYQIVENKSHFYSSGYAFGKFQNYLSDFDATKLYEVIPNFHNTAVRLDAFEKSVKADRMHRAKDAAEEIAFVRSRAKDCGRLVTLLAEKKIPCRVTHNDTKFNNVMIDDKTGEGVCVIDLDTVMPGSALYDFGDAIRSGATTALEDEPDLGKVFFDLELFEAFSRGFLDAAGEFITATELFYMPFSARLMTLECGMRFLADYLDGDRYFKIHRENHNLDRARNQFKLVGDMESKMDQMQDILRGIAGAKR